MTTITKPCILCGNDADNKIHEVPELQLGMGDLFHYQLCSACGSLQLLDPPADLGKYYPGENYYSFNQQLREGSISWFKKVQTEYLLYGRRTLLGKLFTVGYRINEQLEWLKYTRAGYQDAILDVGTGNGGLLATYASHGFTNLTGIDPFMSESRNLGNVRLLKKSLFDLDESFDVIMLHHSLEHMFEPLHALKQVYRLLKPGGRALVRIPVMGNYGWKHFGTYWCGIDAPRHIFVPSEKALKQMAVDAGFKIERFYYDSYDYVVWCSEQYKNGIALHAPNSQAVNPSKSMFTKNDLKRFRSIMASANKKGNGDMAAIYLAKD